MAARKTTHPPEIRRGSKKKKRNIQRNEHNTKTIQWRERINK
jgi:hypothetical protein